MAKLTGLQKMAFAGETITQVETYIRSVNGGRRTSNFRPGFDFVAELCMIGILTERDSIVHETV